MGRRRGEGRDRREKVKEREERDEEDNAVRGGMVMPTRGSVPSSAFSCFCFLRIYSKSFSASKTRRQAQRARPCRNLALIECVVASSIDSIAMREHDKVTGLKGFVFRILYRY
ncbi:hypothetical protein MLD38_027577 [Melastoma candidum]|uniref:Uncharacterized protein n=1 Tax=Melastoma candidum TaxID=119954 RepID=A0ACB9P388_9MYRT|nr:hypothetical protein MLD38_027577 [Melastoma candidum]